MYMGAFLIIYSEGSGWNFGISRLYFLGTAIGMLLGLLYCIWNNKCYKDLGKQVTPETRLPLGFIGAFAVPITMFAFIWTIYSSIYRSTNKILSSPFGFRTVLTFLTCLNYVVDAYTIYVVSVLAAIAMLGAFFRRSLPIICDADV